MWKKLIFKNAENQTVNKIRKLATKNVKNWRILWLKSAILEQSIWLLLKTFLCDSRVAHDTILSKIEYGHHVCHSENIHEIPN